ncbi:uncharacterized protein PHALS_01601 [Plasmopara halstedii]|uniref:Uncharacterized protein n=1 Tax=Plasmopara halstedii TaxID=4781 RepID=A0A0P1ASY4_PLAHL|nr:uncharacterized protein PHALS_01601 [Plasmopara halstedii]CEG45295.1 hypothetical protein PHALS_01601 [Plasmopara halstedii]|eukprot:XP_024581664.1 hypothetical protein PHALS_01601 [Plasmopara halstedii]
MLVNVRNSRQIGCRFSTIVTSSFPLTINADRRTQGRVIVNRIRGSQHVNPGGTCKTTLPLHDHINNLKAHVTERSLTMSSWRRFAAAIARADGLKRDITDERELRRSLEEAVHINLVVTRDDICMTLGRNSSSAIATRRRDYWSRKAILDLVAEYRYKGHRWIDQVCYKM